MPLKALQSLAGQVNWRRDYGLLGYISATFLPPPQYIHVQSLKVLGRRCRLARRQTGST